MSAQERTRFEVDDTDEVLDAVERVLRHEERRNGGKRAHRKQREDSAD